MRMETRQLVEAMEKRHSVRTYTSEEPSKEVLDKVKTYMDELNKEYVKAFRIELIKADEIGKFGMYGVIRGARYYLSIACKEGENHKVTLGYALEKLVLYCTSIGLGTVWVAGTFQKSNFAKAMKLNIDEKLLLVIAFGYEAEKQSLVSKFMKSGITKRKDFEEIFFDRNMETGLTKENAGIYADALRKVQIAPSAMNRQPWRIVKDGNNLHFYVTDMEGYNLVDLGIALAHFHLAVEAEGIEGEFLQVKPLCDTQFAYYISWLGRG